MRQRITLLVSIVVLFAFLIGGGYWLWQNKSRADTINTSNTSKIDVNLLKQLGVQKPLISPDMLVKMPAKYSKAEIENAIVSQASTQSVSSTLNTRVVRTARQNEILGSVTQEINKFVAAKTVTQPVQTKSLNSQQATQKPDFKGDIVIYLADSQGNLITPQLPAKLRVNSSTLTKTVADNFIFDTSVPANLRQSFIDAYPKIEAFYGPRSDNRKIQVFYDPNLDRGYYNQYSSSIMVDSRFLNDKYLVIHELAHAFHGLYCQTPLWEEGMAEATAEIISQQNGIVSYNEVDQGYPQAELWNLPNRTYDSVESARASDDPYTIGSMVFAKIFVENPNFFKQFNTILYAQNYNYDSNLELINIASKVVSKIEGKPVLDWFSHQYAFFRPSYIAPDTICALNYLFQNLQPDFPMLMLGGWTTHTKINLKLYSASGQLLGAASNLPDNCDSGGCYLDVLYSDIFGSKVNEIFDSYEGLIKLDMTATSNPNNHVIQYIIKANELATSYNSIIGLVAESKADSVKIQNLTTGWSTNIPIINGFFATNAIGGRQPGKYKVDVYSSGKLVDTGDRYFNLALPTPINGWAYTLVLQENYDSYYLRSQVYPSNNSVSINTSEGSYTSQTLSLNGFPIDRVWDQNHNFSVTGLQPNTTYQYQITQNDGPRWGGSVSAFINSSFKTLGSILTPSPILTLTPTPPIIPIACKPATITYAGMGPAKTVKVGAKYNIPVKLTNSNAVGTNCPTTWGLLFYPLTGWSTYGYSSNFYVPFKNATYRVINVAPGQSVVTSVTLNAPTVPATGTKITLKVDDYPAGKLITLFNTMVDVLAQ